MYAVNEIMNDGWNFWQVDDGDVKPKARYVRLLSPFASKCKFAEIEVEGIVYLATDITDTASYQCDAVIKQRDSNEITLSNAVEYRSDKTSIITSITPNVGTTIGNTAITITGTNFF